MNWDTSSKAVSEYQQLFLSLNPQKDLVRRAKAMEISSFKSQQSFAIAKIIWEFVDPALEVNVDVVKFVAAMVVLSAPRTGGVAEVAKELTQENHSKLMKAITSSLNSEQVPAQPAPVQPVAPSLAKSGSVRSIPAATSVAVTPGPAFARSASPAPSGSPSTPPPRTNTPLRVSKPQDQSPSKEVASTAPKADDKPAVAAPLTPISLKPAAPSASPAKATAEPPKAPSETSGAAVSPRKTAEASGPATSSETPLSPRKLPEVPSRMPVKVVISRWQGPKAAGPRQDNKPEAPSRTNVAAMITARKKAEEEEMAKKQAESANRLAEAKKVLIEKKKQAQEQAKKQLEVEKLASAKKVEEDKKKAEEALKAEEAKLKSEEEKKKAEVAIKVAEVKKKSEEVTRQKIEFEKKKAESERKELEEKMKQIAEANRKRFEQASQLQKADADKEASKKVEDRKKSEELSALRQKLAGEESARKQVDEDKKKLEAEIKRLQDELKKKASESEKASPAVQDKSLAELKKKEEELAAVKAKVTSLEADLGKAKKVVDEKAKLETSLKEKESEIQSLSQQLTQTNKKVSDESAKRVDAERDRDDQVSLALKKAADEVEARLKLAQDSAEKERKLRDDLSEATEILRLMEQEKDLMVNSLKDVIRNKSYEHATQHLSDRQEIEELKSKIRLMEEDYVEAVESGESRIQELEDEVAAVKAKLSNLDAENIELRAENEDLKQQLEDAGVVDASSSIVFVFDKPTDGGILDTLEDLPPHVVMTNDFVKQHKADLEGSLICRVIVPSSPEKDAKVIQALATDFGAERCLSLLLWSPKDSPVTKLQYLAQYEQLVDKIGSSKRAIVQWASDGESVVNATEAVSELQLAVSWSSNQQI